MTLKAEIDLKPIERLVTHLKLQHPAARLKDVKLSSKPGFILVSGEELDIRGVGYPARIEGKYVSVLRLWTELHDYFTTHVQVERVKNGNPTVINWQGREYIMRAPNQFKRQ